MSNISTVTLDIKSPTDACTCKCNEVCNKCPCSCVNAQQQVQSNANPDHICPTQCDPRPVRFHSKHTDTTLYVERSAVNNRLIRSPTDIPNSTSQNDVNYVIPTHIYNRCIGPSSFDESIDMIDILFNYRDHIDYNTCAYIVTQEIEPELILTVDSTVKSYPVDNTIQYQEVRLNQNIYSDNHLTPLIPMRNLNDDVNVVLPGSFRQDSNRFVKIIGMVILDKNNNMYHVNVACNAGFKLATHLYENFGKYAMLGNYIFAWDFNYNRTNSTLYGKEVPKRLRQFFSKDKPNINNLHFMLSNHFKAFVYQYENNIMSDYGVADSTGYTFKYISTQDEKRLRKLHQIERMEKEIAELRMKLDEN